MKITTREELTEMLKRYRGILTDSMINYLNSLIELEFSVIREYIGEDDRKSLAELEIYKRIAIYNIYNRALNLFNEKKIKHNFSGNEDGLESLTIFTPLSDNDTIKVFNFDYKGFHSHELSTVEKNAEYKAMEIGTISLYQTLENQELREAELERVMTELEKLYDKRNPYPVLRDRRGTPIIGGARPQWAFDHSQKIAEYEKRFAELDSRKELSDDDKRKIEITNQIRNLFLEDYGLTNKSFEEKTRPAMSFVPKSKLEKTLVKSQPNLTIINNIKYI